jgi:thiol:disulfide interchange protein DsbA
MKNHLALACLLVTAAVGCGQEASNPEAAPAVEPAAAQPAPAAPEARSAATPAPADSSTPSDAGDGIEAGEALDTGEEDVKATSADTLLAAAMTQAKPASASRWQAGVHYSTLVPAQHTNAPAGKVEVVEMFWYGCNHCYSLEPFLENWKKKLPAYVQFTPVPVTWGPAHRAHARLYYTLAALGKEQALRTAVFKEIQVNHNMLASNDPIETEQMQLQFARRQGVSEEEFRKTYNSFAVETSLQRAEQLTRRYGTAPTVIIDPSTGRRNNWGVPMLVINGKYAADVSSAGGQNQLIELINDLAAREDKKE